MLQAYLNRPEAAIDETRQAHLVPGLVFQFANEYPRIHLSVGFDKLYVVKSLKTFLDWVQQGEVVVYGKRLTLCHALAQFDPQSQALIQLLMNEFQAFRSLSGTTERVTAITILQRARAVCLTGDSFDRFFRCIFIRPWWTPWKSGRWFWKKEIPQSPCGSAVREMALA